jgi:hypothetical protein
MTSNSSGGSNIALGWESLHNNISGNDNIAIGRCALELNTNSTNIAIGYFAGNTNVTGAWNTIIGYTADVSYSYQTNSTCIGYNAVVAASNQAVIGNSSVNSIGGWADWTTWSDKRFKRDLSSNVPGLSFIMKLNPVTYRMDVDAVAAFLHTPDSLRLRESEAIKAGILYSGFVAQEVEQAANEIGYDFSGVDKPQNAQSYYGLRYAEFTVPLVKAVQEQQAMIEEQKARIESLQEQINELKQIVENRNEE